MGWVGAGGLSEEQLDIASSAKGRTLFLPRYLAAPMEFFAPESCRSISAAADGSRIGGLEILLIVFIGATFTGETNVCWVPPQAQEFESRGNASEKVTKSVMA